MAVEHEELKLVVSLDDQATGKLEQIKRSAELEPPKTFTEAFKRSFEASKVAAEENYKKLHGMNEEHEKTRRSLVAIGGEHQKISRYQQEHQSRAVQTAQSYLALNSAVQSYSFSVAGIVGPTLRAAEAAKAVGAPWGAARLAVGGMALGVAAVGAATALTLKTLYDYSGREVEKARTAARYGVGAATQQNIISGFALAGKSRESALEAIGGAAEAQGQFARPGSPLRREMLQGLQGQAYANQVGRINALATAPNMAEYFTRAFEQGQEVYQGRLNADLGAVRRRAIQQGQDPDAAVEAARPAAEARAKTLQRSHLQRAGVPELADLTPEEFKATGIRAQTKEEEARAHTQMLEAVKARYELSKVSVAFGTTLDKFSAALLPIVTQTLTPLSSAFKEWADSLKPEDFQKFADAIGAAATAIAGLNWSPFVEELQDIVAGFEEIGRQWRNLFELGARVNAEARRRAGLPETEDARTLRERDVTEAAQDQRKADLKKLKQAGGGAGAFAGPPDMTEEEKYKAKQVAEQGPPITAESVHEKNQQFLREHPYLGTLLGIKPDQTIQPSPTAPQPITAAPQIAELEESRLKGEPVFATRTPTIPPMSQQAPVGIAAGAAGREPDFATFTYDKDKGRALIEEQNKALQDLTTEIQTLNGKMPFDTAATFDERFPKSPAATFDERWPKGPMMQDTTGGQTTFNDRWPKDKQSTEATGAASFNDRWGGIDRAPLYSAMQRDMTHRVEGNAKLTVDISAPPGTSVDAQGDDLFASIDINRQVVMEPAATTKQRSPVYR